ncbi:MAG: hypothetical protein AAF611_13845 [Bacteroidota bacterium]
MKKQTLKNLALKKVQISKLENISGGVQEQNADQEAAHWLKTCLGDACPITMFIVCAAGA